MPAAPSRRHHILALAACLLLAVVWTWPLSAHLSSRIPHDAGDPLLNTYILWWNAHAVPFTGRWWSPAFFVPMPDALALSEHLLGIALFTTPIQLAGANAVTAYNVALVVSFALSGFFAYALAHRLTGSRLAGVCAGLAFGFSPYRASQLSHLQVLTSQWMPLMLLALHAYAEEGRARWLAVFGAAWVIQGWSNGYYLLFLPLLVVLWIAWFADWRRQPARAAAIGVTWLGSSLLLLPALLKYASVLGRLGLSRTRGDIEQFSATAASFLHPAPMTAFWPAVRTVTTELSLFPGVTAVVLILLAVVHGAVRRDRGGSTRKPLLFYSGAALVMAALALGPAPAGSGPAALLHPYSLLMYLPGFSGVRVPARFGMLVVLCLSTAAGLACARLAPSRPGARWLFAVAVVLALLVEGWMKPVPLLPLPPQLAMNGVPAGAVLELPVDDPLGGAAAMYRSIAHGRPLVSGYSGYNPPHYVILSHALRRRDPSALVELARRRSLVVAVNNERDPGGDMLRLVTGLSGIEPLGPSAIGDLFFLPAQPAARTPAAGSPLLVSSIRELAREHVVVDLGAPHTIRTVAFAIGANYLDLGARFAVEASDDGETWRTVWEDWTGGPALAAALRDPLTVPVQLTMPDIRARYLRIHPAPRWLIETLTIHEPM